MDRRSTGTFEALEGPAAPHLGPTGATMTEQLFLGLVEIDSGMLLVADPSHVLPSADENKPGVDYSATLGATGHAQPIANGAALLLGSFGGDGTFPVFGHFVDGELMRVTIDLFEFDETDE